MINTLKKVQRGFAPLAIIIIIGITVAVGALIYTPQSNVYATTCVDTFPQVSCDSGVCDVDGLNDSSTDADAVQCAVNQGGTVNLTGTFNFGDDTPGNPRGSVTINNSVNILGEADNQENPLTVINGGNIPFYSNEPTAYIKIQYLHFDGAKESAIYIKANNGVDILHNKIENLKKPAHPDNINAIVVGKNRIDSLIFDELSSGEVNILYNDIDAGLYADGSQINYATEEPWLEGTLIPRDTVQDYPTVSRGINIAQITNNGINISYNTIKNAEKSGLGISDVFSTELSPVAVIEHNIVTTSPWAARPVWNTAISPNNIGIEVVSGEQETILTKYAIKHNDTTVVKPMSFTRDEDVSVDSRATAIGLWAEVSQAEVSYNTLNLDGAQRGIVAMQFSPLWPNVVAGHDNIIKNNTLTGSVTQAGMIVFTSNNVILGNNFSNLTGGAVWFLGGAGNNVLVGGSGTVQDFPNSGNVIKGNFDVEVSQGGVGQQVSCGLNDEGIWDLVDEVCVTP